LFANRFTAFVDACSLAGTLRRNLLLSLAEAEFFRICWSEAVLVETQKAIERILTKKAVVDAADRAARARRYMEVAFEDAMVTDYGEFLGACRSLPDPGDAHVVAAALKAQASVLSADAFIADTITLCKQSLAGGPKTTKELAMYVMGRTHSPTPESGTEARWGDI
jgi:hypothetical protein